MRVAIFNELYAPSVGGQESRAAGLAHALSERGHETTVYCIAHDRDLAPVGSVDGITVHRHPVAPRYQQPLLRTSRSLGAIVRYTWWTRRIAARGEHDLHLYMQWPVVHAMARPRAAADTTLLDWCEIRAGRFYGLLQRRAPRYAAHNFAVSDAVAASIASASGRPVTFLPSGICPADYDPGRPRAERRDVLCLGRIAEHKDIPLLVEAFARLGPGDEDRRLLIAGSGPAEPMVADAIRAQSRSVADRIEMLGQVSRNEKARLLATCGVMVIPSRREGFPNVVIEAMASALPVVTVDQPLNGTRQVVAQYGIGRVTEPTPDDLAHGITAALADAAAYGAVGLQVSARFAWDAVIEGFFRDAGINPGLRMPTEVG